MSLLYFFNVFKKGFLFRLFLILYIYYWEGGIKIDWFFIMCNIVSVFNMVINFIYLKWFLVYFMDGVNFLIL